MKFQTAEEVAAIYWRKMKLEAIREIELKLSQYKTATPNTIKFWLTVHTLLEKRILKGATK